MDYGAVSTTLMFAACETRQCVKVQIVDDETLEMTESFIVTLDRTPALDTRITLNPVDGDIVILENEGRKYELDVQTTSIHAKTCPLLIINAESHSNCTFYNNVSSDVNSACDFLLEKY